jgi:hypothetical protein
MIMITYVAGAGGHKGGGRKEVEGRRNDEAEGG